jgi:hypothetical protein
MPERLSPPENADPARQRPALRLKDAQYILAREYAKGAWKFGSWEELKAHVDAVCNCTDALIVEQIGRLTKYPGPSLLNAHRFLGSLGVRLKPHLIQALRTHPDANVRCNCLAYLDHLNFPTDDVFVGAVMTGLSDRVPKVRRAALHTLCCRRCKTVPVDLQPEHVQLLVQIGMTDENAKVRAEAEGTLVMLTQQGHETQITNVLQEFARAAAPEIRERAHGLLKKVSK